MLHVRALQSYIIDTRTLFTLLTFFASLVEMSLNPCPQMNCAHQQQITRHSLLYGCVQSLPSNEFLGSLKCLLCPSNPPLSVGGTSGLDVSSNMGVNVNVLASHCYFSFSGRFYAIGAVSCCPFSLFLCLWSFSSLCMALLLTADQRRWLDGRKGGKKKQKGVSMQPDSSLGTIKDPSEPQCGRKGSNFQMKIAAPAGATTDNAEPDRYD